MVPGMLLLLVNATVKSWSSALLPTSRCMLLPQAEGMFRFSPPLGKYETVGLHKDSAQATDSRPAGWKPDQEAVSSLALLAVFGRFHRVTVRVGMAPGRRSKSACEVFFSSVSPVHGRFGPHLPTKRCKARSSLQSSHLLLKLCTGAASFALLRSWRFTAPVCHP